MFIPTNNSDWPVLLTCAFFRLCCQKQHAITTKSFFQCLYKMKGGQFALGNILFCSLLHREALFLKPYNSLCFCRASGKEGRLAFYDVLGVGSFLLWCSILFKSQQFYVFIFKFSHWLISHVYLPFTTAVFWMVSIYLRLGLGLIGTPGNNFMSSKCNQLIYNNWGYIMTWEGAE